MSTPRLNGPVRVYTGGKVSKGVASAASFIEGLPEGPVTVTRTWRGDEKPNSVHMAALAQGVGVALAKGATELEVYSPSKNAIKSLDQGGASYEKARDAILSAWVVYWREDRCESFAIEHRPLKAMPEVEAAAAAALKRPATEDDPF